MINGWGCNVGLDENCGKILPSAMPSQYLEVTGTDSQIVRRRFLILFSIFYIPTYGVQRGREPPRVLELSVSWSMQHFSQKLCQIYPTQVLDISWFLKHTLLSKPCFKLKHISGLGLSDFLIGLLQTLVLVECVLQILYNNLLEYYHIAYKLVALAFHVIRAYDYFNLNLLSH